MARTFGAPVIAVAIAANTGVGVAEHPQVAAPPDLDGGGRHRDARASDRKSVV